MSNFTVFVVPVDPELTAPSVWDLPTNPNVPGVSGLDPASHNLFAVPRTGFRIRVTPLEINAVALPEEGRPSTTSMVATSFPPPSLPSPGPAAQKVTARTALGQKVSMYRQWYEPPPQFIAALKFVIWHKTPARRSIIGNFNYRCSPLSDCSLVTVLHENAVDVTIFI